MPEDVLVLNIMDAVHKAGAKPVVLWLLGWVQQSFYLEVFQDLCDNFLPPLPGLEQEDEDGGPAA